MSSNSTALRRESALCRKGSSAHHRLRRPTTAALVLFVATGISASILLSPLPAAASSPSLKITPSEIYYPCSEGNVKFTVKGFAPDKKVKLRSGSTTGTVAATIKTSSSGKGSATIDFSDVMPGSYPYYAVQGGSSATATLTVGECP